MGRGERGGHWGGGGLSEPEGENIGREGKTIKGSGAPEGRQKIGKFIKTDEINPEEVLGREAAHEKSPLDELLDMEEAIKTGNYSPQELKDLKRELERLGEGGFDSLALELENKERGGEGMGEYRDKEGTERTIEAWKEEIKTRRQNNPRGPQTVESRTHPDVEKLRALPKKPTRGMEMRRAALKRKADAEAFRERQARRERRQAA